MSNLSDKEQAKIVEKLISSVHEVEEFDEDLYDQLDARHQMQVDDAIREYADAAVGSDTWDSDE
jgi:L-lysine 2,3-aminomutase